MTGLDLAGWVATVILLASYFRAGRRFDWANATMAAPLAAVSISHGSYPPAVVSISFGLIGAWRLFHES